VRHGESSLAVVDERGVFLGLVPPTELLAVFLAEHDEDLNRLAGVARVSAGARSASTEPVLRRLRHRLPWLIAGLAGAVLAAEIVGAFEGAIEANVALAFFMPGIVYMADAVGTQTETLVVRGFSVGVPLGRFLVRELITGLLIGGVLAALLLPVVLLRWGDAHVAWSVALALFSACSVATGIAMALPAVLEHAGVDPAFGSGPLATVVQDLLSILIYFVIASALT
jgi:magnesium transporter